MGLYKLQRKLPRNFRVAVLTNSRKFPEKKICGGVFFALILVHKSTPRRTTASEIMWESRCDGFLLCRCSGSKMLEHLF